MGSECVMLESWGLLGTPAVPMRPFPWWALGCIPPPIRRRHLPKSIRCCQNFVRFVKLSDGGREGLQRAGGQTSHGQADRLTT